MSLPPSMIVEPTKKNPDALTSHGLNLLWGNTSQGIQGMTELIENMRFQGDSRFEAALEECRHGKLRNETYQWLMQFVLCGPDDPRLTTDHFSSAKMIVATNDLKYAINSNTPFFMLLQIKNIRLGVPHLIDQPQTTSPKRMRTPVYVGCNAMIVGLQTYMACYL